MFKIIKKYIFLIMAIIVLIYLAFCDVFMTFSISMNVVFITGAVLLILLQYIFNHPVNLELRAPSFAHIFVTIASLLFFISIILLILINVLYPKNYLDMEGREYDYIIVFGAGISENKNEIMNDRLDTAIEYAKKYKRCRFVLTGAKGENEPIEEAIYMKDYMTDRGINDNRIIVDPFSVNTSENVENALELIKKDVFKRNPKENIITRPFKNVSKVYDLDFINIGFMSSEFHLTRINLMAKKLGIKTPYDIPCETRVLYLPYLYVREDLSLFKALVLNQLRL